MKKLFFGLLLVTNFAINTAQPNTHEGIDQNSKYMVASLVATLASVLLASSCENELAQTFFYNLGFVALVPGVAIAIVDQLEEEEETYETGRIWGTW